MTKMYLKLVLVFVCLNSVTDLFVKSEDNVIKTTSGSVKGQTIKVLNQKIEQYLGIPYAEPPVGSLRFAKPKPISKAIEGVIDGTKPKYSCNQQYPAQFNDFFGNLTFSEDCLTLNIWSPKSEKSSKLKPVMFWIYGGGLSMGSIFQTTYNGSVLATNDVVFVSVNYRLGIFGFLYGGEESAPGNVGFYDQLLGLEWVRENIHLFGGDKNQITIFGESAGSFSISALLLSPLAKGLFKRAVMESGALLYNKKLPDRKEKAINKSKQIAKQLNCTDDKQWLQCLRKVDAKLLLPSSAHFTSEITGTEFLPFSAQNAFNGKNFNKDLDLMAGVTKDEGLTIAVNVYPQIVSKNLTKDDFVSFVKTVVNPFFGDIDIEKVIAFYLNNTNLNDPDAIKWKISDLMGDLGMKCPTYLLAKRYAEHSSPKTNVFFYELTHKAKDRIEGVDLGIQHGADVDFVFGLLLLQPNTTSKENIRFSKEVLNLWTNFAKYGKPDNNWPKLIDNKSHFSVTQIKDLNPKDSNKYFKDLFGETCDGFWKNYF